MASARCMEARSCLSSSRATVVVVAPPPPAVDVLSEVPSEGRALLRPDCGEAPWGLSDLDLEDPAAAPIKAPILGNGDRTAADVLSGLIQPPGLFGEPCLAVAPAAAAAAAEIAASCLRRLCCSCLSAALECSRSRLRCWRDLS